MRQKSNWLCLFFFFCLNAFALDIQVSSTNETCTGNGSLSFNVTNQVVGVPVFYTIYLLPNTTTPIATLSTNSYGGLVAGNYLVVASQTVGSTTTTAQQSVNITNQIIPLTFTVSEVKVKCGNDGQITVNVSSGVAVSYQLLSGPVVTGTQSNNVFPNLPVGQYDIRVFDSCGEGVVQTFILTNITPLINILSPIVVTPLTSCNSLNIKHLLTSDEANQIFYPLTVQVTALPPSGGAPVITTQTVTSSPLTVNVPSFEGVSYVYNILITDACGNVFVRNNNTATAIFDFSIDKGLVSCNDYNVTFNVSNFVNSYTINFLLSPATFNPALCNTNHPGPFSSAAVTYGNAPNYLPNGNYIVEIVDSCGFTQTKSFFISEIPSSPNAVTTASSCGGNGNITIGLNPFRALQTAILTSAPSNYPNPLPENISSFININGNLYLQNVPQGVYNFTLTDVCGNPYTLEVTLIGAAETPFLEQRPGCIEGDGSLKIYFPVSSALTSVEILEAPSSFGFTLPYDVSFNIVNGQFYMNSLPAGSYKFKVIDNCGNEKFLTPTIIGYTTTNSVYNVTENCGSFNLQVNHTSNGNYITSYWLQKYDAVNDVWEHPSTGIDYVPGSNITNVNAIELTNNSNNLNLAFSGTFRVVKMFYNFSNGSLLNNRCVLPLYEFDFTGGPKIIDAFSFPCSNNTQEVMIIATGLPPLQYKITEKNGVPFVINNGTSNTFLNLETASYNFEVSDICGNVVNRIFDVSLLNEPQIVASNLCDGTAGQLEIQNFPFVTYQWFNTLNPSVILSTSNTLEFTPFNSATDIGTYAVQLSTANANSCINQTIEYTINDSGFNPNAGNDDTVVLCKENQSISLNTYLSTPHDTGGVWVDSDGDVVSSLINPIDFAVGDYEFTYIVNGLCLSSDSATITITIKDLPQAPVLSAPSPICRGEEIQLNATSITNATYFWTGPNGFTSADQNPIIPSFEEVNDGDYFVFVEVDGCNSATEQMTLNSNPLPDFSIDGVSSLCIGVNENLTIVPNNFSLNSAAISWSYNGIVLTSETDSTLEINQIGTYLASIEIDGCISQKTVEITEKVNSFDVVLEQGCNQKDYEINIVNEQDFPNATYSWTGPNGFVSYTQNIIVPNLQIGTYTVEVIDVLGCKSGSSALVENTNCFIPNGFSPDDDGFNDSFDLTGFNVKKIYVYNRYGRLVYDKDNYINEWRGQTNDNKKLPASTYFYVLEFNEGENKTGWVYVTY
jgi:gliding motility-associated-like protein